jgi:hypothetical protein
MIGLPAGTRIWLAAGVTDMRALDFSHACHEDLGARGLP